MPLAGVGPNQAVVDPGTHRNRLTCGWTTWATQRQPSA